MRKLKSIVAILLALFMIAGIMPNSIFAEDLTETSYYEETSPNEQEAAWLAEQEAQARAEQEALEQAEREAAEQAAAMQEAIDAAQAEAARQQAEQQQAIDEAQTNEEVWEEIDEVIAPTEEVVEEEEDITEAEEEIVEETSEETTTSKAEESITKIDLGNDAELSVIDPDGVLPDGATIEVKQLGVKDSKDYLNIIKKKLGDDYADSLFFDVRFKADGKEITPSKDIELLFNNIKISGKEASLYSVADGKAESLAGPRAISDKDLVSFDKVLSKGGVFAVASVKKDDVKEADTKTNVKSALMEQVTKALSSTVKSVKAATANEDKDAEKTLPAFNASQDIAGTSMRIVVDAPEGAFPENIRLFAGVVETPKAVLDAIESDTGDEVKAEDALSIDVHFYLENDPGTEIEPLIPINVTFSNIDLDAETVDVYHETEKIAETSGEGGSLTLDEFSTYTFVATNGDDVVVTNGDVVTVTIPNQNIKLDPNGSSTSIAIADITTTYNSQRDEYSPFNSTYWTTPVVSGNSVEVNDYVITAKGLGKSSITMDRTTPDPDPYWENNPLSITFEVNVTADVEYDGNGQDSGENYTQTYREDTGVDDGSAFTKFGHEFAGWSLQPVAYTEGATYLQPGDGVLSNALYADGVYGKKLYAVWKESEPITITISKVWDDDNNRDAKRPNAVTFNIEGTIESESAPIYTRTYTVAEAHTANPIQVSKDDSGKKFYKEVNGEPVTYTVTEAPINDYTTVAGDVDENGNVTITNKHKLETVTIHVDKEWDDADNQDGIRPDTLYIHVLADGAKVRQRAITADGGWSADITSTTQYKYREGQVGVPIDYTIVESANRSGAAVTPDGYTPMITGDAENGFTVTNTHTPETVTLSATKVWKGEEGDTSRRPASLDVNIMADGTPINEKITLTEADSWTGTKDLPKYTNPGGVSGEQKEIEYTVEEVEVAGYRAEEITGDAENGFTLTNTYIPNTTTVTINKVWNDSDDADGIRPDVASIKLMNNGKVERETNLRAQDGWTITFKDVPVYTDPTNPDTLIDYKVEEENNAPYVVNVTKEGDPFEGYTFTVTNTHESELQKTISLAVKKHWDDERNEYGTRKAAAMHLESKPFRGTSETYPGSEVTVSDVSSTGWVNVTTYTDLPVYAEDGTKMIYFVHEENIPEGYEVTSAIANRANQYTGEGGGKDWIGIDAEKVYQNGGSETVTFTNKCTLDDQKIFSLSVFKTWEDEFDIDGMRADTTITVEEVVDGNATEIGTIAVDTWGMTDPMSLDNLPVYKNGKPITYRLTEAEVDGYETSIVDFADMDNEIEGNTIELLATDYVEDGIIFLTFTNTHEPITGSITVTKTWNDDDNRDGLRPETLPVTVTWTDADDVEHEENVTLSEAEGWTATLSDLPVYKEKGVEQEYTVTEDDTQLPEVYEAKTASATVTLSKDDPDQTAELVNKYEPTPIEIKVTKTWDDASNQDGKRPAAIMGHLKGYVDGEVVVERDFDWGGNTTWTNKTTTLTKDKDGNPFYKNYKGSEIEYVVTEDSYEGYTTKIEGDVENGFTVTNTHDPETRTIYIDKIWKDASNQDGIRPEKITIIIKANDEVKDTVELTADDYWDEEFGPYPVYADGTKINYSIEEAPIDGYTPEYEVDEDGDFVITNTHEPATVTVTAAKTWDDDDNRDKKRPEKITYHLFANGENIQSVSTDQATYEFTDLPRYKAGKEINYVVLEAPVNDYTSSSVREEPDEDGNLTWSFTNTYTPEQTTIKAIKYWDDADNQDGKRPASVEVKLQYKKPTDTEWKDVRDGTKVLSEDNFWKTEWTVKTNNSSGTANEYQVVEVTELGDYTVSYYENDDVWTITNTHKPEVATFHIVKKWVDDNNRDGIRPTSVTFNLEGYTGSGRPQDFDFVSQEKITLAERSDKLDDNTWDMYITRPVYADGEEIKYYLAEDIPQGYTADNQTIAALVIDEDGDNTVTNTHEPERVTIDVTKVWNDNDDQDGKRPTSVFAKVYKAGEESQALRTLQLTETNEWHASFTRSDMYKYENGKEIQYIVKESAKQGATIVPVEGYDVEVTGSAAEGFTITNTHVPETADLRVVKTWVDGNNQDGLRPDALIVTVRGKVGDSEELYRLGLSAANAWTGVLEDMPVYNEGEPIEYTVTEPEVPYYDEEHSITEDDTENLKEKDELFLINVHEPETINIHVTKVWDDENNHDKKRPEEITYTLFANGTAVDSKTVSSARATWDFEGLPQMLNGQLISYSVVEAPVDDYTTTQKVTTELVDDVYTINVEITNKRANEKTTITAIKEWDDDNDRDGVRPEGVDFILQYRVAGSDGSWAGYSFSTRTTVSAANNWQCSWTVNTVDNKGRKLEWRIVEAPTGGAAGNYTIPNYPTELRVIGQTNGVFTVKNVHKPEKAAVTVTKEWKDGNNRDGLRPANLKVTLKANGYPVEGAEALLSEANEWKAEFPDLPVKDGGEDITYTVEEEVPEGYTPSLVEPFTLAKDVTKEITITNTHTPELVEIPVTKVWDDNDDQDGFRPDEIYAAVYANGVKVRQRALNEDNGWATTIKAQSQYKYENGKEIKYTVKESWKKGSAVPEDPKGKYTTEITGSVEDGFTITNTHKPATSSLTVTKKWDDNNDQDGFRPDSINVTLTSDSDMSLHKTVGLSAANGWTYTWEDLPIYHNRGEVYRYTVEESITDSWFDHYTADESEAKDIPLAFVSEGEGEEEDDTYHDAIITNKHTPETIDITVNKTWDDSGDQDGKRPSDTKVTLLANGRAVMEGTLTGAEDTETIDTFKDLPVYENGEKITYTVVEQSIAEYTTDIVAHPAEMAGSSEGEEGEDETEEPVKWTQKFDITNSYTPGMRTITVVKSWDDADDQDGIRPSEVQFSLNGIVDDGTSQRLVYEASNQKLNDANEWTLTFDVPVMDQGYYIEYSVEEDTTDETIFTGDAKTGYVVSYSDLAESGYFTITNTHEPKTTDIDVEKHWVDNNDQDGIRPQSIIFHLMANGKLVSDRVMELSAANVKEDTEGNTWAGTFIGLPVFENGEEITYSIEEEIVPGYTPDIGGVGANHPHTHTEQEWVWQWNPFLPNFPGYWQNIDVVDGNPRFIVVNTHETETTSVTATKTWNDADDQDGFRTDANNAFRFQIKTYVNGAEVAFEQILAESGMSEAEIEELVTPKELPVSGNSVIWADLPKYYQGEPVEYSVEEVINEGTTIHIPIIDIDITIGAASQEERDAAAKYEMSSEMVAANVWAITNTHIPETINITVNKTWADADDVDGIRPEYVEVQLMKKVGDGEKEAVRAARINGAAWTYTFTDLPKYEGGKLVEYSVEETAVEGYMTSYDPENAAVNTTDDTDKYDFSIGITNQHIPETTNVIVVKSWDDNENQDGVRPDKLRVTLLADGAEVAAKELNEANDWGYSFESLPKYQAGKEINYTVVEESIDEYTGKVYAMTVEEVEKMPDADLFNFLPDVKDRVVKAVELIIPDDITLQTNIKIFAIENKHVPGVKDVTVVKNWDDEDDFDGIRPDKVTVKLMADGAAAKDADDNEITAELTEDIGWTYTFKEVPINKEGKAIAYTVEETEVPEGYEASYTNLGGEGGFITVTNKHEVLRTDHTVKIEWDDNDNQDGLRPEYVNVYLMRNGERVADQPAVTLSPANGWTYTWKDLPAGDYSTEADNKDTSSGGAGTDGAKASPGMMTMAAVANKILRAPEENAAPAAGNSAGYSADEMTPLDPGVYTKTSVTTDDATRTTTIVNTYAPKNMTITGHKIWVDNDNQDGARPESITVNLYADGDLIKSQELTAANADDESGNKWKYEFTELPRYIDGTLVHYTVSEEAVDNYTLRVSGYDLYNSYTPGKTFATVIKLWDDDRDRDGIRPENVIVRLLADGEEVNRASISAASGWFTVFTDLDMNKDGKAIEYTVTEDAVADYTSEITGDAKAGFIVTNSHESEKVDLDVNKVWSDDNNKDKKRPNSITVNVLVNGVKVDTHILTEADGWKTTFTGLPKYSNGQEVAYTLSEDPVEGYSTAISGNTITNTLRPEKDPCVECCKDCGNNNGSSGGTSSGNAKAPKTGDNAPIALYIVILVVAGAVIGTTLITRRRRNNEGR